MALRCRERGTEILADQVVDVMFGLGRMCTFFRRPHSGTDREGLLLLGREAQRRTWEGSSPQAQGGLVVLVLRVEQGLQDLA